MAFHIDIVITEKHLLKANPETEIDLFLTIAFWCIYRYILIRNMSGEDNRKLNLEYMFKREIYKRIEVVRTNIITFHNNYYTFFKITKLRIEMCNVLLLLLLLCTLPPSILKIIAVLY